MSRTSICSALRSETSRQCEAAVVGVERIREIGVEDRVRPRQQDGVPDGLVVDVQDPGRPEHAVGWLEDRREGRCDFGRRRQLGVLGVEQVEVHGTAAGERERLDVLARRSRIRTVESVEPVLRSHEPGLPGGGIPAKTVTTIVSGPSSR